jgi:hypothetical protein
MYTLTFQGVAGPESDVAKARLYINGVQKAEADVTPGQQFTIQGTWPTHGDVTVEYSFVDGAGNESGKHNQTVTIPDKEAPAMPMTDLTLVSVVWA